MKNYLLITVSLLLTGCGMIPTPPYTLEVNQANYQEYGFTLNTNSDSSSKTILTDIQKNADALSYPAETMPILDAGHYTTTMIPVDTYTVGSKQYSVQLLDDATETYTVYDGAKKLFEHRMCWPAEQADGAPELLSINEVLAIRFFECTETKKTGDTATLGSYTTNMYYDGQFINQTYGVINTSFVFTWNGKLGFVADKNDQTYIFYDDKIMTPSFDTIHTKNCCAVNELIPTLYDNGVLAFYGSRHEQPIIAELKLE